MHNTLVAVVV